MRIRQKASLDPCFLAPVYRHILVITHRMFSAVSYVSYRTASPNHIWLRIILSPRYIRYCYIGGCGIDMWLARLLAVRYVPGSILGTATASSMEWPFVQYSATYTPLKYQTNKNISPAPKKIILWVDVIQKDKSPGYFFARIIRLLGALCSLHLHIFPPPLRFNPLSIQPPFHPTVLF
jgi:hypothetical protein